jgi:hypothetical protein
LNFCRKLKQNSYHFVILSFFTVLVLSIPGSASASSKSPYESGYDHGYDDAQLFYPSEQYINQPGKGPEFHTSKFMNGYYAGYAAYEVSIAGSPEYDCSEGSDGCNGNIYCDIDDSRDLPCYDRYD